MTTNSQRLQSSEISELGLHKYVFLIDLGVRVFFNPLHNVRESSLLSSFFCPNRQKAPHIFLNAKGSFHTQNCLFEAFHEPLEPAFTIKLFTMLSEFMYRFGKGK